MKKIKDIMRILVITSYYKPAYIYGGPVRSIHRRNQVLAAQGHAVHTFTTNANGTGDLEVPTGRPVLVDGLPVTYFRRWWLGRSRKPFSLFFSPELGQALKQIKPGDYDLMLIHAGWGDPGRLAAQAAQRTRTPYIYYTHGIFKPEALQMKAWKKRIYYQLIEKKVIENANGIVVNNNVERDILRKLNINIPIKNIPWGINIPNLDIRITNNINNFPYILFLGRLNPIKGLDLLIESYAKISNKFPDWRMILAGQNERGYKNILENIVKRYSLEEKIIFPGIVLGEHKASLLSNAELCVLPSYSESFGMAALEAMAYGKPIIITSTVGLAEHGVASAGRIVSPERQALANALEDMMGDKTLRQVCGAEARRLAETTFTWDAVARESLAFYREVLSCRFSG